MKILPLESADVELLSELQPQGWDDIRIPHRYYVKNRNFCSPLKFVTDDVIAGIGTCVFHKDVAWLAHIIVHPDFRNKGLGYKITSTLIDRVRMSPYKTISLIATDLGEPVYKKAGFESVGEYYFLRNENQQHEEKVSPNIHKYEKKFLDDVFLLDKAATGEDRSSRLTEFVDGAFVYATDNRIEGFYMPDFVDGLIIASNPVAGIELMKLRNKKRNIAALPVDNKIALEFLYQNNFQHYRTAKRMTLGKKTRWKPDMIYNRVSGQIG